MTGTTKHMEFALLCRVGFEPDLIDELNVWYQAQRQAASIDSPQDAVVRIRAASGAPALSELVFARDMLLLTADLPHLDSKDRVSPLAQVLDKMGAQAAVTVLTPDSEATKPLAPLVTALQARLGGRAHPGTACIAQVWMLAGTHALVGQTPEQGGARFPGGLPRLKFPREAPSRSTLKLDEAFQVLMTEGERMQLLRAGGSAVDLGAAPGGWTYQLVARQIRVIAIDNGRMDTQLCANPLVQHLREDGFRYRPPRPVDWLVCDMVEKPGKVAELVKHWFLSGYCRAAVFNLKLPMKRRFEAWSKARQALQPLQDMGYSIRARQLYHDREELTVAIVPPPGKAPSPPRRMQDATTAPAVRSGKIARTQPPVRGSVQPSGGPKTPTRQRPHAKQTAPAGTSPARGKRGKSTNAGVNPRPGKR